MKRYHKMKKEITCIITDLDNTVWNWFKCWHTSFKILKDEILKEFGVNEDLLLEQFETLHKKFGSTEYSFLFENLDILSPYLADSSKIDTIKHKYYKSLKDNIKVYEGVTDILKKAKKNGTKIIGFTESHDFFTKRRIKHLNLDGYFDIVYAPLQPKNLNLENIKTYDSSFWETETTEFRYLPSSAKKPDAEILRVIIEDNKLDKEKVIYIGDKLHKDISMANDLKIISVHAKYGESHNNDEYELLKKVTHWSANEVEHEIKNDIVPNYILDKSYIQLKNHFKFSEFKENIIYNTDNLIESWKEVVSVQKHFNEISLRIKSLGITLSTFILGGMGIYYNSLEIRRIDETLLLLSLLGIIYVFSMYLIDYKWYHKFLIGAVKSGENIEKHLIFNKQLFDLTQRISISSKNSIISSSIRYNLYYILMALPFILMTICWFINNC